MTLTREQILEMPAGRDMDRLVAVHVMGQNDRCLHVNTTSLGGSLIRCDACGCKFGTTSYALALTWPHDYSTQISDAWAVVEKMVPLMLKLENAEDAASWAAAFFDEHDYEGEVNLRGNFAPSAPAPTAPLAICRAALLATLKEG